MKTKRKTKILSLILAITVVTTMIMAVPFTASAAENDGYAEWIIYGEKASTSKYYTTYNKSENVTDPTYTAKYDDASVTTLQDFKYTSCKGDRVTIPAGSMHAAKLNTGFTMTINTKLSSDNSTFDSYDLVIVYASRYANKPTTITVNENSDKQENMILDDTICAHKFKDMKADQVTIKPSDGEGRLYYVGIKYKVPSDTPSIEIPEQSYNVPVGESVAIEYDTDNLTEELTWESSDSCAKVENGVVEGVSTGEAKITARANDIEKSCQVYVSESKTVYITIGLGISNAKIQKESGGEPEALTSGAKIMDYGKYKITYDLSAPKTYLPDIESDEFQVGTGTKPVLALNSKNNEIESVSFGPEVYNAMYGKTIVWGVEDQKWYPASMHEINSLQQKNIVLIAGAVKGNTEDSDVYMTVQGGKLSGARDAASQGTFQINKDTILSIPVVSGSKISVKNDAGDNKATYTLGTKSNQTGDVTNYDPSSAEVEQGYVELKVTVNGFLAYIELTTPASPITWDKGVTDSGYYNDENGKKGVIRFLQGYSGTAESYGFYLLDKESKIIVGSKIEGTEDINNADGIYADLINIEANNSDLYYMKAFVVVDGKEIWGPAFGGKVDDWEKEVEKPTVQ